MYTPDLYRYEAPQSRANARKAQRSTNCVDTLARSLVAHGQITTTVSRAKELRPFVERLITLAKKDSSASRRLIASRLGEAQDVVKKIHAEIAPRYASRAGGYLRIVKLGPVGNRAVDTAIIEFVT